MIIDVLTLFPKMFESPFSESMISRAIKNKILELNVHNLRKWAVDNYRTVDDKPFGGGAGMLIKVEVVWEALKEVTRTTNNLEKMEKFSFSKDKKTRIIMMSARGKRFNQKKAEELSKLNKIILLSGHYEGFDQRISDYMIDEEISIGDYVLTGGELPSMVLIDTITRLLPGVLGKDESSKIESFGREMVCGKKKRTLEYPQYTRPQEFMGVEVPKILLSGDPVKIAKWQNEQIEKTLKHRGRQ